MDKKKYIIAIDFGTTTIAWSIRKNEPDAMPFCVSPVTNKQESEKKPSDIHFFLNSINEQLTTENSQLGTQIQSKFLNGSFQYHFHFAYYKMMMYDYKSGTKDFLHQTNYPQLPNVEPLNDKSKQRTFTLSEIYIVVSLHVLKSIQRYFQNQSYSFNTNDIAWFITVPAIAGLAQKTFMREIFKAAFSQGVGGQIKEEDIDCIEEPYAGFLYALHKDKKQLADQDRTVAILDFGGGTYDITVARFIHDQRLPKIIFSDFGEVAGGSEVDKKFMIEIKNLIQLEKFGIEEYKMSIIYSNLLHNFQQEKHLHMSKADIQEEMFVIQLQEIARLPKDYAASKYLNPTSSKLINTTSKLMQKVNELKDQNGNQLVIDQAILLGGFSSCHILVSNVKSQITLVTQFSEPSLAIVNGATFFTLQETIKNIVKAIGIQTVVSTNVIDQKYLNKTLYPQLEKYIDDNKKVTGLGIKCLFDYDQQITKGMEQQNTFKPTNPNQQNCVVNFVMHEFQERKKCPNMYAHDLAVIGNNINPVEAQSHYQFQISIPNHIPVDQRYITVRFRYTEGGSMLIYHKLGNEQEQELILHPQVQVDELFKHFEKSQVQPVHTIFCVDMSASMGMDTQLPGQDHPFLVNGKGTLLGDIFLGGICQYMEERENKLGSIQQDRYSIILFNTQVKIQCNMKEFQNSQECYKYCVQPDGNTSFDPALQSALQLASQTPAELTNNLVFLSDGDNNDIVSQQTINNIKNTFKDKMFFIGYGQEGCYNLTRLAKQFGKNVIQIRDSIDLHSNFAHISLPELM